MKIHGITDKLNPNLRSIETLNGKQRVHEFYATSPEDAYSILEAIAEIYVCADKLLSGKKCSISGLKLFKYKGEWLNEIRHRLGA